LAPLFDACIFPPECAFFVVVRESFFCTLQPGLSFSIVIVPSCLEFSSQAPRSSWSLLPECSVVSSWQRALITREKFYFFAAPFFTESFFPPSLSIVLGYPGALDIPVLSPFTFVLNDPFPRDLAFLFACPGVAAISFLSIPSALLDP